MSVFQEVKGGRNISELYCNNLQFSDRLKCHGNSETACSLLEFLRCSHRCPEFDSMHEAVPNKRTNKSFFGVKGLTIELYVILEH